MAIRAFNHEVLPCQNLHVNFAFRSRSGRFAAPASHRSSPIAKRIPRSGFAKAGSVGLAGMRGRGKLMRTIEE
jgi:hypothetical protein